MWRWGKLAFLVIALAAQASASTLPPFASPDDGQWTVPAKNTASTRFSALTEITPANAARLAPAFTFRTGLGKGEEAAPLVLGGAMYIVTPYPNTLFALDLPKPGAPVKWRFDPHPQPASQGVACCDVVNRGAAYGQ